MTRSLSLRAKLTLAIVGVSGLSLAGAALLLLTIDLASFRDRLRDDCETVSRMIARNAAAPVMYADEIGAWKALEPLADRPDAAWAVIRMTDGRALATYERGRAGNRRDPASPPITGTGIILEKDVVGEDLVIGRVVVAFDLSQYRSRIINAASVILVVLAIALVLSFLLAIRLRNRIIEPLARLEKTIWHVALQKNYAMRAPVDGNDEIGSLARAFNGMLGEVQVRDEALADAADHLESQVQQLEREIADRTRAEEALQRNEEILRQSQKMEAVGRLAGGIAHDFNNLLTAVNGFSSLALREVGDNGRVAAYLMEILQAGNRAATLTRQLLAYSRRQVMKAELVDMKDVVRDLEGMLVRLIGENYRLAVEPDPLAPLIRADRGQIEQVLVNLVVNARDAMEEGGGGMITIRTRSVAADAESMTEDGSSRSDDLELTVSDTGCGMDEETLAKVFEPFFTTKEVGKGTGLGLATVHGIVNQSGGRIEVESRPGKGTSIRIRFPGAARGTLPEIDAEAKPQGAEGPSSFSETDDQRAA